MLRLCVFTFSLLILVLENHPQKCNCCSKSNLSWKQVKLLLLFILIVLITNLKSSAALGPLLVLILFCLPCHLSRTKREDGLTEQTGSNDPVDVASLAPLLPLHSHRGSFTIPITSLRKSSNLVAKSCLNDSIKPSLICRKWCHSKHDWLEMP